VTLDGSTPYGMSAYKEFLLLCSWQARAPIRLEEVGSIPPTATY